MPPRAIASQVSCGHLQRALGAGAGVVAQQELQHHGRRELGRAAESAVRGVVLPGQRRAAPRQLLLAAAAAASAGRDSRPPGQVPRRSARRPRRPRRAGRSRRLRTPSSTCRKDGMPCRGCGREVGAEVEGLGVGGEEDGHRPAALAGGGLHGLHVDGVDVGALLAVDLDADEVLVEVARRSPRPRSDSCAMTWHQWQLAVADAEQHGHAAPPRLLEGLGRPGPPVDRVVGVLEEVGGRLMGQSVRHAVHPARIPVRLRSRARRGVIHRPAGIRADADTARTATITAADAGTAGGGSHAGLRGT